MSNLEVFEIPEGNIDVKRMYLPVEMELVCPKCGEKLVDDFDEQYLSYPDINSPETRGVYCDNCESELQYEVKLQVSVEADLSSIRLEGE